MGDHFALLGEPRRPWLEPEALKDKFLKLSAATHPDRVPLADREAAGRRFAELNTAFTCLREPKDRLRHLIELETGAKPQDLQEIPADLADLFLEVARLRQDVGRFLAEKAKAESPMLRVKFFGQAQGWLEKLTEMQSRLREREAGLLATLRTLDCDWQQADLTQRGEILARLEEMHRLLSFHSRWHLQLQEAMVQLTL